MSYLTESEGFEVKSIVTDRHRSITAFIRDVLKEENPKCKSLEHYNDVWHTAKGKSYGNNPISHSVIIL